MVWLIGAWVISLIIMLVLIKNAPLMEEDEYGNYYQVQETTRGSYPTKIRK